jgi:signal transduction histidine kinase
MRMNDGWREGDLARAELDFQRNAFVGWNYLDECRRAEHRGSKEAGELRRGIESVLKGQLSPFRFEYHCSVPNDRWYEVFVDRLQLPEGGAIVTHLDITDRRLAEEARRQVAHLGRVALIGELAATISHELRQPLAAIRANAEAGDRLVARSAWEPGEAREIFRSIIAEDARAVEVIESVRKLLRKDQSAVTTVDLNQICRDTARLLQHDAAVRKARLELSLAPTPATVTGDPVLLQQAVLNLVLNGLEAASTSKTERSVVVHTEALLDHVELLVHDSGPGIPADVQPHLFESFYSTKKGGLGLGLVIVRTIVERHHGRVHAENHSLGGAVFGVRLPMTRGGVDLAPRP